MWVPIEGRSLASSTESASNLPLPTRLAGTSVTFEGVTAPVNYVSANQINAQIPSALRAATQAVIVVTTETGSSASFTVSSEFFGAGSIHSGRQRVWGGRRVYIGRDGVLTLNTPQTSLDPLNDQGLAILLTGIGPFTDRIDGRRGSSSQKRLFRRVS